MPASTDQVEVSGAAFVPVCMKVHGGPPACWGPHSISNCQNSSLADLPKGAGFGPAPPSQRCSEKTDGEGKYHEAAECVDRCVYRIGHWKITRNPVV